LVQISICGGGGGGGGFKKIFLGWRGGGGAIQKTLIILSTMKIGIMISNLIKSMNNSIIIQIIFCKYFLGDFCKKHCNYFGPLHIRNDLMIKIVFGNNNSIGSTIVY
jgi:hypothetical protein